MKKNILFLFSLFLIYSQTSFSQGGNRVGNVLSIPNNSRSASMGGFLVSDNSNPQNVLDNPSLIDSSVSGYFSTTYLNYISGINSGSFYYAPKKWNNYLLNVQYLNYGNFTETDGFGNILGEFTAGDVVLGVSKSHQIINNLTLGANVSGILSYFPQNQQYGMAASLGAYYHLPKQQTQFGLMVKHAGASVSTEGNVYPSPFEIQLGMSKKLAKAPISIHVLAHNLQKWDLTNSNQNQPVEIDPLTGKEKRSVFSVGKLLRHFNAAFEFKPSKNFSARLGYNHQRRKEFALENRGGFTGFSFGTGFKISRFMFDYGLVGYYLGNTTHYITITTKI